MPIMSDLFLSSNFVETTALLHLPTRNRIKFPIRLITLILRPKPSSLPLLSHEITREPNRTIRRRILRPITLENRHSEEARRRNTVSPLALKSFDFSIADLAAVVLPAFDGVAKGPEGGHVPFGPDFLHGEITADAAGRGLGPPGEDVETAVGSVIPCVVGVGAFVDGEIVSDNDVETLEESGHLP